MYIALTILKVLVILSGFGFAAKFFFPSIKHFNKEGLRKAGIIFLTTFLLVIVITAIEFLIALN